MSEPAESEAAGLEALDAALRRLARAALIEHGEHEDVVQETWLARLRRGKLEPERELGWLRTTLRNVARDRRRKRGHRLARERDWLRDRDETEAAAAEAVAASELGRALHAAVAELPEPFRGAVHLRFFEELSVAEIAARLGRPTSTVKSQIQEGLERLRARLDRRFGERRTWQAAFAPWAAGAPRELERLDQVTTGASSWLRRAPWLLAPLVPTVTVVLLLSEPATREGGELVSALSTSEGGGAEAPGLVDPVGAAREPIAPHPTELEGVPGVGSTPSVNLDMVVRAEESGLPIAGATVALVPTSGVVRVLGRTDSAGRFTAGLDPVEFASGELLGNLDAPRPRLVVRAEGYAHSPTLMPRWDRELGARFTVHLEGAAAPIFGRIVDSEGGSVPGAHVLLKAMGGTSDQDELGTILAELQRPIEVDSSGRFVIEDAPARQIALDVSAPGFVTARVSPRCVEGAPCELTVELRRAPFLRGRVYAPDGTPQRGARVGYRVDGVDPVAALSDGEGFYELAIVGPEAIAVSAEMPALRWRASTVIEPRRGGELEWEAKLQPSPGLRLRITDRGGHPAERVELHVHVPMLNSHVGAWLTTDADGRAETFEVDALEHEARLFPLDWPHSLPVSVVSGLRARSEPYEIQLPDLEGGPRTVEGTLAGFDLQERGSLVVHAGRPGLSDLGSVTLEGDTGRFRSLGNLPGPFVLVVHTQQRGRLDLGPFAVGDGALTELGRVVRPELARLHLLWPAAFEDMGLRVQTVVEAGGIGVAVEIARFGPTDSEVLLYPNLYCFQLFQGESYQGQLYAYARSAETLELECRLSSTQRTRVRVVAGGGPARGRILVARSGGTTEPVLDREFDLASSLCEWPLTLDDGRYEASAVAEDGRTGVLEFELGSTPLEPVYAVELR
jgi:RNA polymerase sigma factor (sigma-70 family)